MKTSLLALTALSLSVPAAAQMGPGPCEGALACAANEALVLNTDTIQQAFADSNVEYLVADWTRYDPAITALLADFERNGIPLYVYYPADLNAAPQLLPQVLNKAMVLRLLSPP